MTNLETLIPEAMELRCKSVKQDEEITTYLEKQLTSEKHYKPQISLDPSYSNNEWELHIHIQYTSLNVYDLETIYSLVTKIKELFKDLKYTLTSSPNSNHDGIVFRITLEGMV